MPASLLGSAQHPLSLLAYEPLCHDLRSWVICGVCCRLLFCAQMDSLAPTLGVPTSALIELVGRCLGLVAVAPEVLGAGLANLSAALRVEAKDALELITLQPAVLAAQVAHIFCRE